MSLEQILYQVPVSVLVNDFCKPRTLLDHGGGSEEDFPLEKQVLPALNSLTKPALQR